MKWFRKPPIDETVPVPLYMAESARVSIYAIASHPDLPEHLRAWIAEWLSRYNVHLTTWLSIQYGPEVFPIVDKITESVSPPGNNALPGGASWERWESEFGEGQ